jgi:hypothetical protein
LVLGIGLAIFSRIAMQFLVATFGVEALSFGLPSVPATQILFAVISLLLPLAFVAYALPLSVWARRAAKANLSTKREVDAVSWVTLTRRKVRFFRWFMVGCVAWLFLMALLPPLTTNRGMLLSFLLGLSLYAILGLYSVWVPGAIIRLRWLFETEVGRHFKTVAGFLRLVSWSMPITLAFAGLLPGLVFSSRLGQMSDSLPHLLLGQLLQVNLIVLYPVTAAAFVAVNVAYRKQLKINQLPATPSE